ncbi:MAG: hypothetical protein Q7J10_02705 [Methanosarcinaceae archaeon]|nr:hypothetical protein [Methanosarcinaceae archaeon]
MNQTNKDILALTLWIVSIGLVLAGIYVLYTEYGANMPYHESIFPGRSSEPVELSRGGELAENIAHIFMYMLDLGVPVFAILIGHHLLMSLRSILSKHEG